MFTMQIIFRLIDIGVNMTERGEKECFSHKKTGRWKHHRQLIYIRRDKNMEAFNLRSLRSVPLWRTLQNSGRCRVE